MAAFPIRFRCYSITFDIRKSFCGGGAGRGVVLVAGWLWFLWILYIHIHIHTATPASTLERAVGFLSMEIIVPEFVNQAGRRMNKRV